MVFGEFMIEMLCLVVSLLCGMMKVVYLLGSVICMLVVMSVCFFGLRCIVFVVIRLVLVLFGCVYLGIIVVIMGILMELVIL